MPTFKQFLSGATTKTQPAKKGGSFKSFLASVEPEKKQITTDKAGRPIDITGHVFNPRNPEGQQNSENITKGTTTSVVGNLKKKGTYVQAAKQGGGLAKDFVVGTVKAPYEAVKNPSQDVKEYERITGISKLPGILRKPAQFINRLTLAPVENAAGYVGREILGERQLADKVIRGELPSDVLTTKKPDLQDVSDILEHSANTALTFYAGGKAKPKAAYIEKTPFVKSSVKPSAIETLSATAKNSLENRAVGVKPGALERAKTEIQVGVKPSVKVRTLEDGTKFIEDGRHHLEAAKQLGVKDYPIEDVTSKYSQKPAPTKTSKIAQSIETKAVERKLTQGFEGLAGYDPITIKDQAARASSLMTDVEKAGRVIRGEEALPEGLRGTALITAVEEHIAKTGDAKMAYELANSPLVSETSAAAQELRLAAERQPDSLTVKMQEIKKVREAAATRKFGDLKKARVKVTAEIINEVKKAAPKAKDWQSFLTEITCK
jgi:hypothetical protein